MADEPANSSQKQEETGTAEAGGKKKMMVTVKTPKEKEVIEVEEEATVSQVRTCSLT